MKRTICIIAALAALSLTACRSDDDIWGEMFDDPAEFTAATRVEQSAPELPFGDGSGDSGTEEPALTDLSEAGDSSGGEGQEEEPTPPLNEYGLYDQYFINSCTFAFNAMLAEKHFTCDVTYFFPNEQGGKAVKQYSERNEINGKDRHILTRLESDGDAEKLYDKEVYYIKDVKGNYNAYILNWDNMSYGIYKDEEQVRQIAALDKNIPSALFYGIDDLETAVYLGYLPDDEKKTTTEKFRIENTIYTFIYDKDGILKRAEIDDGRIAKVKSFENSCPPLGISSDFTFYD